tara:strand:+ start:310 stop:507 length:198 start_codon:yes stop_codon:yes gene_type:complete
MKIQFSEHELSVIQFALTTAMAQTEKNTKIDLEKHLTLQTLIKLYDQIAEATNTKQNRCSTSKDS